MEREQQIFGRSSINPIIPRTNTGEIWLALNVNEKFPRFGTIGDPFFNFAERKQSEGKGFRLPYDTSQERPEAGQELSFKFIQGQIDGLRGYIAEHELAQPLKFGLDARLETDGLHYYFGQKTGFSFLREGIESKNDLSKYVKLKRYFAGRLGYEPTNEQLWYFLQNPEIFRKLVSDEVFYTTPLGLEMAEDLGLRRVEIMLRDLKEGEIVVQFSPGDENLRPTKVISNWIRVYRVVKEENGVRWIHTTQIKNFLSYSAFIKTYELYAGKNDMNKMTAHVVSSPFVISMNEEEYLRKIGENLDPLYLATFEETMEYEGRIEMEDGREIEISIPQLIGENVEMLNNPAIQVWQIEEHRKKIGEYAIQIHKQKMEEYKKKKQASGEQISMQTAMMIHFQKDMYGIGSGCGLSPEAMNDLIKSSGQEFGDPNLPDIWICEECGAKHHIRNGDPSTYYLKCEKCGASGKC